MSVGTSLGLPMLQTCWCVPVPLPAPRVTGLERFPLLP